MQIHSGKHPYSDWACEGGGGLPESRIVIHHDLITDAEISAPTQGARSRPGQARHRPELLQDWSWRQPTTESPKRPGSKEHEHQHVANITGRLSADRPQHGDQRRAQVSNYRIGGHYEPHYRTLQGEKRKTRLPVWDREQIATLLMYESEVEQAEQQSSHQPVTPFKPPRRIRGVLVQPTRQRRGRPPTRHAACPVLTGTSGSLTSGYTNTVRSLHDPPIRIQTKTTKTNNVTNNLKLLHNSKPTILYSAFAIKHITSQRPCFIFF